MPVVLGAIMAGAALGGWIGEYVGSLSFFNKTSGSITSGSPDVFVNFKPLARALADIGECFKHGPEPQPIATGSESVFINFRAAARVNDKLQCSGFIAEGSTDVFIGGGQAKYTQGELGDEVAWYYRAGLLAAGLGGALLMGGVAALPMIVGGFAGGWAGGKLLGVVGGYYGDWLSEHIGGTPSDWEKTGEFVGQAIGGWLGAKGGPKAWDVIKRFEVDPNTLGANGGNIRVLPAPKEPAVPTVSEEVANLPGHGHARHGAQTTIAEQTVRAQTGVAPDGKNAPTDVATKFDSDAAEFDAVQRAQQRTANRIANGQLRTPIIVNSQGKARLPTDVSVVTGHPGGYGSGVKVMTDPATDDPLPGRPVQPTGQYPNAKVVLRYNPLTGKMEPVTQYPTDDPVTP
ncbi:MAG: PAAR domain-containing protein [Blastocatellia bacterium]|nr:PAAR domain-containing protein [Blastocatellia bacterium]